MTVNKLPLAILGAAATLTALTASAQELSPSVLSLARNAATVVKGRVGAMASQRDSTDGIIYTYTRIDVDEWIGGADRGPIVVMKQLGGVVGTTVMTFTTRTEQVVGDEVLLMLSRRPADGALYPIGTQGLSYVHTPIAGGGARLWFPDSGDPVLSSIPYKAALGQIRHERRTSSVSTKRGSRTLMLIPADTPPEVLVSNPAARRVDVVVPAESARRWRVADGFRYWRSFPEWEGSAARGAKTFGRWWPVIDENGQGVEFVHDSGSQQFDGDEDYEAMEAAVAVWGETADDSKCGRGKRCRPRIRHGVGSSRPVGCSTPFGEPDPDDFPDGWKRVIGITYLNSPDCPAFALPDEDPRFGVAGFVADTATTDLVRVRSLFHKLDNMSFPRITSAAIFLHASDFKHPVGGRMVSVNEVLGDLGCHTQIVTHMLGHALGMGHTVLAGRKGSVTPAGVNFMDEAFHTLDADPPLPDCAAGPGLTSIGAADKRGISRLMRNPIEPR